MSDRHIDPRPLWMQAAERYELELALDRAIGTEFAEQDFDELPEEFIDEPAGASPRILVQVPAPPDLPDGSFFHHGSECAAAARSP